MVTVINAVVGRPSLHSGDTMRNVSMELLLIALSFINCVLPSFGNDLILHNNSTLSSIHVQSEITVKLIHKLQKSAFIGQVLLPGDSLSTLGEKALADLEIPVVIFGREKIGHGSQWTTNRVSSNRFSSSYFAHINVNIQSQGKKSWKSWRRIYANMLSPNSEDGEAKIIRTFLEKIYLHDFFLLYSKFQDFQSELRKYDRILSSSPINTVWIVRNEYHGSGGGNFNRKNSEASYEIVRKCEQSTLQSIENSNVQLFSEFPLENHKNGKAKKGCDVRDWGFADISISCTSCIHKEMSFLESKMQCRSNFQSVKDKRSSVGCFLGEIVANLNSSVKVSFEPPEKSETDLLLISEIESHNNSKKVKRSHGSYMAASPRVMFRSSLIFIARRKFRNWNSILKPFTAASWLGIVVAYSTAAVVFAVIKLVTLNNPDQSWYDYMVQQLLEIVNDDNKSSKNKIPTNSSKCGDAVGVEEDTSSTNGNNNERGKTSKAVLHATIRMVSFVLVAVYEGKLYNTITFPKSRFISTFDELLVNDKYSVKISREAEQAELFYFRSPGSSNNSSRVIRSANNIESVNIEDCINWVESNSKHACIGYEFEFRNLHKTHKFEKIIAKSKEKINRFGLHVNNGRGMRHAYPAMRISRWVLEAGIFQFWAAAENIFSDATVSNRSNQAKVLTIKDYLGLFAVYVVLLVLASASFFCECIIQIVKKKINLEDLLLHLRMLKKAGTEYLGKVKISCNQAKFYCQNFKVTKLKRYFLKPSVTCQRENSISRDHVFIFCMESEITRSKTVNQIKNTILAN